MITTKNLRRGILSSGSLYLSPPLPLSLGDALVKTIAGDVHESDGLSLKDAPVASLLQALKNRKVNSMWMQSEPALDNWMHSREGVQDLLIGDVEYEAVIWRNGIETLSAERIASCFDNHLAPIDARKLKALYGIVLDRPTSSRIGALDFINDVKFALPAEAIASRWRGKQDTVYQYVFDETNPWQSSSRAHHALDLIFLFGGYDLSFKPSADAVGKAMRKAWISFINGVGPWNSGSRYAFGPHGKCGEIDQTEFEARRRVRHWESLQQLNPGDLNKVVAALAAGQISLLN